MIINNLREIDGLIHLLVPLIIIRIITLFYNLDKKVILFLSTFTLIPDIDFFIFWHRATFHNLFFGTFLVILAMVLIKNYSKLKIALVGSYFFLSHIILDGFFVDLFYPIQKFHYNIFTGKKITLEAMNAAKPHFSIEVQLIGIIGTILIYSLLIYEIYYHKIKNKQNAKQN